jgi:hypothetical protein
VPRISAEPRQEILTTLAVLHEPGDVVELRVPDFPRARSTVSGYFDDPEQLADEVPDIDGRANGIYVTLNRLNPALLARRCNRIEQWVDRTTTDAEVLRRRWLPLDFDPVRPPGISSTDAEHAAALERASACRAWLAGQGWPDPVRADSGNGCHLLYRVDLPNDEAAKALVERCLHAIAARFSDEAVTVDTTVGKAAQIWKLYGTTAGKGDSIPDRPHRRAYIAYIPAQVLIVSAEQLEAVAAEQPSPGGAGHGANGQEGNGRAGTSRRLNVGRWLAARGVPFRVKPEPDAKGRTVYVLDRCPFDEAHGSDACVMQDDRGKLFALCFHNGCSGNGWKEFKARIGPPDPEHYDGPPPRRRRAWTPPREDGPHLTDVGNARRVVERHGHDLHYCHPWRQFLIWDGRRWAPDEIGEAVHRVKETQAALYREVADEVKELTTTVGADPTGDRKRRLDELVGLLKHALEWEDARAIERCLKLVPSEVGIPVLPAQLDTDPLLLNVQNGTVDLRTGTIREHRREDLLTKLSPVTYDPTATCPLWLRFLHEVFDGDEGLLGYLRRLCGYSATGVVRDHLLIFLYGTGRNGKSTLVEVLLHLLGEYATKVPPELLTVKRGEAHPAEKVTLFGRRLAAAMETEDGKRLAEAQVKELTGGDTITGRRMRENFWNFLPTHKLWIAGNHRPAIRGGDLVLGFARGPV